MVIRSIQTSWAAMQTAAGGTAARTAAGGTAALLVVALVAGSVPRCAAAQDLPIVETHRIRLANQPGGAVEVSLDAGRSWQKIGQITRPASVTAVGGKALEAIMPATVAGSDPDAVTIRVPTTLATPRWMRIAAAGQAPNNAAFQTDIPASDSIFRALAPPPGSRALLDKEGREDPLPTNYLPRTGDRVVLICERSPDMPTSVFLENKPGGQVMMVTPLGEEKPIGRVRQPLRGIGRYAGTERAGSGSVIGYEPTAVTISTAGIMRRLDANDKPAEDRGGFVIQPAESDLKGATHPDSQLLVEAMPAPGRGKAAVSPLFGLPVPLSTGVGLDTAQTKVEVRLDGGEWQPMPDLRGGIDAPQFLDELSKAAGKPLKEGITHLRIVPGAATLGSFQHFVRLAAAPRAARGVQRGRVTITANAIGAGIAFVSFYLDGTLTKVTNQSPFVWDWDTTRTVNGPHLVEIRGADDRGAIVNTVLTRVTVDN